MYERFTDRARKVMQLANQEAQRFNHEYIGTEHILLGLVKEGSGVAANVLKNLDIDLRKIRLEVKNTVQSGSGAIRLGKLPQTPRVKKAIEYSMEEAGNLNHNHVGTGHLLLGLLREQEGVAAEVLINLGLELQDIRERVHLQLREWDFECESGWSVTRKADQSCRKAREYDLFIPLRYSDGTRIEPEKIARLREQLAGRFGFVTSLPQENQGAWTLGNVTFPGEMVILHILADDPASSREFLLQLKEDLKGDLRQEEILIVGRDVALL